MSDNAPITGELRDAMKRWGWIAEDGVVTFGNCTPPSIDADTVLAIYGSDLDRMCDAIDAIHANLERENESLRRELDRVMEDHDGRVELPKDADGEAICAGDKLDGYGKTIEVVELRYGRSGWVLISRDGNAYADTYAFLHHAPTVEDVLREFAEKITDSQVPGVHPTYEEAIIEYAKRLTLAGE